MQKKKEYPKVKSRLHPRNKHRSRYDFKALIISFPDLASFVSLNKYGDETIDFANPEGVRMLNAALLKHHYDVEGWTIPPRYLCPPIPGRADYIHYVADALRKYNYGQIPLGAEIKCLDIGVGASCIYPILGVKEYGWTFIGSDIDPVSIKSSEKILDNNPLFKENIELRLQAKSKDIFYGVLRKTDHIDLSICNPPFHASLADAQVGTKRKIRNLNKGKPTEVTLNFGGQNAELWCTGGEKEFIRKMVVESKKFAENCLLFSTLVSKQSNLNNIYKNLEAVNPVEVSTIPMGQGNKTSRIVTWTFFNKTQQKAWRDKLAMNKPPSEEK